jgi:hypothetical protein
MDAFEQVVSGPAGHARASPPALGVAVTLISRNAQVSSGQSDGTDIDRAPIRLVGRNRQVR